VELQAKAEVRGDVHYKSLEVQLGAIVHGVEGRSAEKVVSFKAGAAD